ncbi:class I SAM-dependent methyltransferase [Variovorax sp. PCZ-1]|uniref:class I SAM-dependent methyltransferase n=1 Tax=Variovorax sp. PCZ-1 TaxID=2835533 RepID=UPI001BD1B152|nr:class I SAM-dependent methyltransferase [Variovorax sp. PCZ-1]MBS7806863.1 class I SAM-dependent methyltransferase [Variovorax sp. PCZ-1]
MHGTESVSNWVARWSSSVPHDVAGGRVLDVACGAGRHLLYFLKQKRHVAGIDIAQAAIESIANQLNAEERSRCLLVQADIENGAWPLPGEQFAGVIVTNYLWRPLLPTLLQSVAEGGVLIYETFCAGNETVGKPSRPDFLLQPGELLRVSQEGGLRVIAYEDGFLSQPDRFMQRITCVREKTSSISPSRHRLQP